MARPGPREPWPALGRTHGAVYRGKPGPARMPAPGVPGYLVLGQPAWGRYLPGQRELAGRPGREKGAHVPAGPGSWPARGTGQGVSLQKECCGAWRRPGQAQQWTGPGGPRSSYRAPRFRGASSGLAPPFPWHWVLLSQQAWDGLVLGRAAGRRQEIDLLVVPPPAHF